MSKLNVSINVPRESCEYNYNQSNVSCSCGIDVPNCYEEQIYCYDPSFGSDDYTDSLRLVDPFNNYVKKMRALFGADPDVTVVADELANVINICVAGCEKPDAYRIFFPGQVFINKKLKAKILVNGHDKTYKTNINIDVLKDMFRHHPLVADIKMTKLAGSGNSRLFVLFKNQTIQYVNDNFGSLYCATTTVPEKLVRQICLTYGYSIWWSTVSDFSLAPYIK